MPLSFGSGRPPLLCALPAGEHVSSPPPKKQRHRSYLPRHGLIFYSASTETDSLQSAILTAPREEEPCTPDATPSPMPRHNQPPVLAVFVSAVPQRLVSSTAWQMRTDPDTTPVGVHVVGLMAGIASDVTLRNRRLSRTTLLADVHVFESSIALQDSASPGFRSCFTTGAF